MSKKAMYQKVILSGGYISRAADGGAAFCSEVVDSFQGPTKILECLFGLPNDTWGITLEKDRELFRRMSPDAKLGFQIAVQQFFVGQIKQADVIYFRGGETQKLYDCLKEIQGWQEALKNKTVVGASAGAYILSEFYVPAAQPPELKKGFGLVPVKTVTHYRSTFLHEDNSEQSLRYWDQVDKLMKDFEPYLKAVQLCEGEYV